MIYFVYIIKFEMDDTITSIIAIISATIIMFLSPVILIADRSDDISQLLIQTSTSEFVNEVIKTGKITLDNYQRFISSLQSSGNTYDIDMEVKILDETTSKIVTQDNPRVIGNNTYYSIYTSQIEDKIGISSQITENNRTGQLILKQGDLIFVTVKNNSQTLSQVFKNFYSGMTSGDLQIVAASSSGTININGAT